MSRLAVATALLLVPLCCAAKYEFQHSLDGGSTFTVAGTIKSSKLSVELDREPSSSSQEELQKLIDSDGFYIVRVPTGRSDQYASASVRAACLATEVPTSENLNLHVDADGKVASLAYSLDSHPCKGLGKPFLPVRSSVVILKPSEGPMIINMPSSHTEEAMASAYANDGMASSGGTAGPTTGPTGRPRGRMPDAPSSSEQGPKAGQSAGERKEEVTDVPPLEEKSWWQKNWLLIIGGGMALMNIMGNLAKQTQAPPQAAAGGARTVAARGS